MSVLPTAWRTRRRIGWRAGARSGWHAVAAHLPPWLRTVRVRLALTWSAVLFAVSGALLTGVYAAVAASTESHPLDPVTVKRFERLADGTLYYRPGETFQAADLTDVQQYVNHTSLERMRDYGLVGLAIMFVLSIAIGWWVAGRALRPVERITGAAREISGSDLSRRIDASGPPDELRMLSDTIDDMLARLDAAFAAERRLVEDVSHELRNPVAVVQANLDAVLASDDATPAQRQEAINVVGRATARMSRLLEDLLATARLRAGGYEEHPVDLAALVAATAAEHRLLAAPRDVSLPVRAAAGPVVYAEPAALARAFGNLLANAVRVAPAGSAVVVAVGSVRGWAWAAVRDDGPGIAAAEQDAVFERFRRSSGDAARSEGAGLGLAIARQIVESHQGRIAVHSVPGAGSTFVVWLPDRAVDGGPDRTDAPPAADPLAADTLAADPVAASRLAAP